MSEKEKAPGVWGVTQEQFLWNLRGRRVTVLTVTGQAFAGTLVGTSLYAIIIR